MIQTYHISLTTLSRLLLFLALPLYHLTTLPLAALEPGSFYTDGPRDRKAIALTFDDGPGEYTKQVLDILDRYRIKATFFMNGDQVELRPETAREVLKRGHEIGDHTYSHINFYSYLKKNGLEKTRGKIGDEIGKSKGIIEKTTGVSPRICRMPNGFNKPWMKDIAKTFGYSLVNWTFGEDWQKVSGEKMIEDYRSHVRPGAILLLHDGGKNRTKTVQALPGIIEEAQARNIFILTVGELLKN